MFWKKILPSSGHMWQLKKRIRLHYNLDAIILNRMNVYNYKANEQQKYCITIAIFVLAQITKQIFKA